MFCAKCGAEVPDEYSFCTKCGSAVPQAPPTVGLQKERTSKVSRWRTIFIVLSLVLLTWAGSAGIAYGVVELTGGGPEGEPGEQGEQGPKGARGARGPAGSSGTDLVFANLERDARIANALTVISLVSNLGGFQSSSSPAGEACFGWLMFGDGSITDCGFTR